MSAQQALPLPLPAASNAVVINARCSLRIEGDQGVIVVAGLPVHHYRADDAVAGSYAMVFLVESGFAEQIDVARAFARSARSVRRYQRCYAQGGMAALGRTLLHELFATAGDIRVTDGELHITLDPLSSPHRTHATQVLCQALDQTATVFPGSRLRIRFAVRPPPRIGLAFPASPAGRHAPAAATPS